MTYWKDFLLHLQSSDAELKRADFSQLPPCLFLNWTSRGLRKTWNVAWLSFFDLGRFQIFVKQIPNWEQILDSHTDYVRKVGVLCLYWNWTSCRVLLTCLPSTLSPTDGALLTTSFLTASEHWPPCHLVLTVVSLPLRHSQVFEILLFLGTIHWQRRTG